MIDDADIFVDADILHTIPCNDLRPHVARRDCWCKPTLDDDTDRGQLWIHHAMDGREAYEAGERKPS